MGSVSSFKWSSFKEFSVKLAVFGHAGVGLFVGPRYRSGTTELVVPTIRGDGFGWIDGFWIGRCAFACAKASASAKAMADRGGCDL